MKPKANHNLCLSPSNFSHIPSVQYQQIRLSRDTIQHNAQENTIVFGSAGGIRDEDCLTGSVSVDLPVRC